MLAPPNATLSRTLAVTITPRPSLSQALAQGCAGLRRAGTERPQAEVARRATRGGPGAGFALAKVTGVNQLYELRYHP